MWLCPFLSPAYSEEGLSSHGISFSRFPKSLRNHLNLLNLIIFSDLSFYFPLCDPSLHIVDPFSKTAVFCDQHLEVGCRNPYINRTILRFQLCHKILMFYFGISLPRFHFPCAPHLLSNKVMAALMRHF